MTVLDLIGSRADVYAVRDETTVYDAARYLRERQGRAVGVLDANGRLVGVVSQSDVSDKVAAENKCPAWMRVSEIMSTGLVTVTPDRGYTTACGSWSRTASITCSSSTRRAPIAGCCRSPIWSP